MALHRQFMSVLVASFLALGMLLMAAGCTSGSFGPAQDAVQPIPGDEQEAPEAQAALPSPLPSSPSPVKGVPQEDGSLVDDVVDNGRVSDTMVSDIPAAPPGSLAVFFMEYTDSISDSLAVQVQEVSPYGEDLGGYGKIISWDTNYESIIGLIPSVKRAYELTKVTSASYASSAIYPITKNGKLYVARDWDTRGGGDVKSIQAYDPMTGSLLQNIDLAPPAVQFAIVGDKIYYRSEGTVSLTGIASGGDLYVVEKGNPPKILLSFSDMHNTGALYGVGDALLSVIHDGSGIIVREHDPATAKISRELHHISLPQAVRYELFAGETALYLLIPQSATQFQVKALKLDGSVKDTIMVELEPGETWLQLDEEDGKLVLAAHKSSPPHGIGFDEAMVYDMSTGETTMVDLGQFITLQSPGPHGNQFYFLR